MTKLVLVLLSSVALMSACSTAKCRTQKEAQTKVGAEAAVAAGADSSSSQDRVRVYKPDGSLQCGQGRAIPLNEMEKDLKGIKTYSSINKNDGMMRIQVCGSPTGNCNIYEIDRKDLAAALKAGFKEWTFE
ncbi:hypothetical protein [Bdellovibrio sp. HCB2-146]|uniref:hypothetical protein n=1 Tax=Bdellovibrio sp. HCB2-146 TaxID=3394362 RepID=UPI0039BD6F56